MSVEELKEQLSSKVIEVMDLCDSIMNIEQHVGVMDITVRLFITALYSASGRGTSNVERKDFTYPLPELEEIECTLESVDIKE